MDERTLCDTRCNSGFCPAALVSEKRPFSRRLSDRGLTLIQQIILTLTGEALTDRYGLP